MRILYQRAPAIIPLEVKTRLWAYIGGIPRLNEFKALAVGGMLDHAHVLLSLPPRIGRPKAVRLIKGGSSKWINDHLERRPFAWQDGYGVFTIGISQIEKTIRYIENQEQHHKKRTFAQEWTLMLERHGIKEYPERAGLKSRAFSAVPCGDLGIYQSPSRR